MPTPNTLSDADHIRSRPGLYVGGLNAYGRRVLVSGLAESLLDLPDTERPRISITLCADGFIELVAHGAAPDFAPEHLVLHPGQGKLTLFAPQNPSFPYVDTLAFPIADALCDPFDIEITRAGRTWSQSFARGLAAGPLHEHSTPSPDRTHLRFRPDPALFKDTATDFHALCGALQSLALFHPTATLTLADPAANLRRDYHYPRGPLDYLHEIEDWAGHPDHARCFSLDLTDGPDRLRAAILYRHVGPFTAHSFLNGHRLLSGTHTDGFRQALAHLATQPNAHPNPHLRPGDDPAEHLTAVFALTLAKPDFESATKDCLRGPRARDIAYRATLEQLPAQLAPSPPGAMP